MKKNTFAEHHISDGQGGIVKAGTVFDLNDIAVKDRDGKLDKDASKELLNRYADLGAIREATEDETEGADRADEEEEPFVTVPPARSNRLVNQAKPPSKSSLMRLKEVDLIAKAETEFNIDISAIDAKDENPTKAEITDAILSTFSDEADEGEGEDSSDDDDE